MVMHSCHAHAHAHGHGHGHAHGHGHCHIDIVMDVCAVIMNGRPTSTTAQPQALDYAAVMTLHNLQIYRLILCNVIVGCKPCSSACGCDNNGHHVDVVVVGVAVVGVGVGVSVGIFIFTFIHKSLSVAD